MSIIFIISWLNVAKMKIGSAISRYRTAAPVRYPDIALVNHNVRSILFNFIGQICGFITCRIDLRGKESKLVKNIRQRRSKVGHKDEDIGE